MMYPRAMALAQDEWKAVGSYLTRKSIDFATNPAESISKGLQGFFRFEVYTGLSINEPMGCSGVPDVRSKPRMKNSETP